MRKKRKTNRTRSDTSNRKKAPRYVEKLKVNFQFTDMQGVIYNPPDGRIKIGADCGVSFLIKFEGKWKPVKGKLNFLKVKYERKLLVTKWKVPRKTS